MSDIFSILEFEAALPHLSSAAAADVKARVGSVTITVVRGGVLYEAALQALGTPLTLEAGHENGYLKKLCKQVLCREASAWL